MRFRIYIVLNTSGVAIARYIACIILYYIATQLFVSVTVSIDANSHQIIGPKSDSGD